jgi:hypothetical protein
MYRSIRSSGVLSFVGPLVPAATLALLALMAWPGSSAAQLEMRIEAESFARFNELGAAMIQVKPCDGASEGMAVSGLDTDGEYLEWDLLVTQPSAFVDSLRSAGNVGVIRHFKIQVLRSGEPGVVLEDTLTTPPGAGMT